MKVQAVLLHGSNPERIGDESGEMTGLWSVHGYMLYFIKMRHILKNVIQTRTKPSLGW